ncbi:MAG TPA: hypothetical protein VNA89_09260 [Gemmatimonadaceae bacterium]|nr:hypothetical protein [Gemmatimonadaceae bacterium]
MRTTLLLLALVATTGCGTIRKTFGLRDPNTAHTEPRSTSVWGDWVLATPTDSTAFVGAQRVEMSLTPGSFTLVATYPGGQAPMRVVGNATLTSASVLTLTPSNSAGNTGRAMPLSAGQPVSVRATAAGNTLVFAPPREDNLFPSSVWHKRAAAAAAGRLGQAARDSAQRR